MQAGHFRALVLQTLELYVAFLSELLSLTICGSQVMPRSVLAFGCFQKQKLTLVTAPSAWWLGDVLLKHGEALIC